MSARSIRSILRAVIYARVSKDDESRGRSCKEQIESCTADCEYEGWPIAQVLMDNDRGASRHSRGVRVEFAKLPDILTTGDVLVVWEPSRITRNMLEFGPFCDLLADRGVLLYYDGRTYDMNDDDDRNRVWQDILDGAKQAGKTRKRTMRALDTNYKELKPHGKLSPGYVIERDPRTGTAIRRKPDPKQARILREAAQRALDRESLRTISRDLAPKWAAAGGKGFEPRDIKRALLNPSVYGLCHYKGEILGKGTWDGILDPDILPTLTELLADPNRLTHHGTETKWLLTFIARCGVCIEMEGERGIISYRGARSKGIPPSYVCDKYRHVSRSMERVDKHVEKVLFKLMALPETAAKLAAPHGEGGVTVDEELAEIKRLREAKRDYIKNAARTGMSAESVAEYVVEMELLIKEAQARVTAMTSKPNPLLADLLGSDRKQRWDNDYSIQRKRETLREAFDVVIVPVEPRGRYSEIGVEIYPRGALAGR